MKNGKLFSNFQKIKNFHNYRVQQCIARTVNASHDQSTHKLTEFVRHGR